MSARFNVGDRVRYFEGEVRDGGVIRAVDRESPAAYRVTWDENPEFNNMSFNDSELVNEDPA